MTNPFWKEKTLEQMTDQEWESLCDGCARCCLLKLEDDDTGELFFTSVSCHQLNIESCSCKDYTNRKFLVPECLLIRQMKVEQYQWLPETCAYRLISENKPLPEWHPLITTNTESVKEAGISVSAYAISEDYIHPEQVHEHIIDFSVE